MNDKTISQESEKDLDCLFRKTPVWKMTREERRPTKKKIWEKATDYELLKIKAVAATNGTCMSISIYAGVCQEACIGGILRSKTLCETLCYLSKVNSLISIKSIMSSGPSSNER